jgi:hypothetical protein
MPARAALAALLLASALPAQARPFTPPDEVVALRIEIAALQLDRALALTPDQARALLPLLQKGAAEAQSIRARMETADPALVAALTRARDELRSGSPVSESSRQAIAAARKGELGAARGELRSLRKQALSILTPAQVDALDTVQLGAGPETHSGSPEAGRRRGPGRRLVLGRVLTSEAFLALVEARAR